MSISNGVKALRSVHWGSIPVPIDSLSFLDRVFIGAALAGVLMWSFPHVTLAHTINDSPLVFEINELAVFNAPPEDHLAKFLAADAPVIPPDPRIAKLQEYLESKKTPLALEADLLLKQYHYRLIIGIAFAESNSCKYQIMPNNCWGIGGGYPERYPTLADGVIRANELIQKYQDNGMVNPQLMRNTWVGWPNQNWVIAVEQITQELEALGL